MGSKKQKVDYAELASTSVKKWTEKGEEQKELERLFKEHLIDETDTPNSVREKHKLFLPFSSKVFGVHFRLTKAKLGVGLRGM